MRKLKNAVEEACRSQVEKMAVDEQFLTLELEGRDLRAESKSLGIMFEQALASQTEQKCRISTIFSQRFTSRLSILQLKSPLLFLIIVHVNL